VLLREDAPSFLSADADWGFGAATAAEGMEDRERVGVLAADGWLLGAAFSCVATLLAFFSGSSAVWSCGGGADFDIAT
jgi:hypothetical protein